MGHRNSPRLTGNGSYGHQALSTVYDPSDVMSPHVVQQQPGCLSVLPHHSSVRPATAPHVCHLSTDGEDSVAYERTDNGRCHGR